MAESSAALPARNVGVEAFETLPVYKGGIIGELISTPEPKLVFDLDVANDAAMPGAFEGMRTVMALPIFAGQYVVEWIIGFSPHSEGFGALNVQQGLMISNLMGMTNAHLLSVEEVSRLNRALVSQFEEVAKIQQALLPARLPEIPSVSLATSYLACDRAGGDCYDFFPLSGGRWGVFIADVSGHGAGAATVMAMVHVIMHCYDEDVCCPAQLLSYINEKLLGARIDGSFVTAFLGLYDPTKAEFVFANAGHPPPRLKRGEGGSVIALDGAATLPLGIFRPMELQRDSVRLEPQDTLIFYTDGIVEEFSPAREMFGTTRLDEALHTCSGAPDCVMESVHKALYAHTGKRTRADDQTLVAFRFHGHDVSPKLVTPRLNGAAL
jgi:sigma-B regulation protein RsbU (phosphoserine phosphatase)